MDPEKILKRLKPGDIITHSRCAGGFEEHVYTGMDGEWVCGYPTTDTMLIEGSHGEVNDISPKNITHVNRIHVDMLDMVMQEPRRPYPVI